MHTPMTAVSNREHADGVGRDGTRLDRHGRGGAGVDGARSSGGGIERGGRDCAGGGWRGSTLTRPGGTRARRWLS